MSVRAEAAKGPAAAAAGGAWLIAVVVALAAFMETLDTTIANVALRYIAGGLGVSEDEASWVVTTYLVANAIIVTATSYLAKRFGRKAFFLACLATGGPFITILEALMPEIECPVGLRRLSISFGK